MPWAAVEGDPFAAASPPSGGSWMPVDHDPFAAPSPAAPASDMMTLTRPAPLAQRVKSQVDAIQSLASGAVNPLSGDALTNAASSAYRPLAAGLQGTSPHIEDRPPLGTLTNSDSGPAYVDPTGNIVPVDTSKHVILPGEGGKQTVYARTPGTDESRASSLGRILGFGMIAPAEAPLQLPEQAPSAAQNLLKDFEEQKVNPDLASVSQSKIAGVAKTALHEGPASADVVAAGTKTALGQTSDAAQRAAGLYGDAVNEKQAGDVIQEGVQSFAGKPDLANMSPQQIIAAPTRAVGLKNKAEALFDRIGSFFGADEPVALPNTLDALKGPVDRFTTSPELGKAITNPTLQKYYNILKDGGALTYPEMKEFRSFIGRQLDGGGIGPDSIPVGDLKTVYGALTKDIEAAATAKGPQAARAFSQANAYYKAADDRIALLQKFVGNSGQASPESAYSSLLNAAQTGTKGDINRLYAARRAIPDGDWGNIAAATIRTMGRPISSQADPLSGPGFSVGSFLTNYAKMSDAGKDVIFNSAGMGDLKQNLDQLVRVVNAQKNVEKLANVSGTGRVAGMIGAYTAFTHSPVWTALGLAGSNVAARAIMNPTFVKWLYSGPKTVNLEPWVAHLGQLEQVAANDKALAPVVDYLHQALVPAFAQPSDNGRPTRDNIAPPIR